jgi:hypothetical protein
MRHPAETVSGGRGKQSQGKGHQCSCWHRVESLAEHTPRVGDFRGEKSFVPKEQVSGALSLLLLLLRTRMLLLLLLTMCPNTPGAPTGRCRLRGTVVPGRPRAL